jgi:hypothetical protein
VKANEAANLLRGAADRARNRSEFLASVFARYEEMEGTTEDRVRKQLGATVADWSRLQLCLKPRMNTFLQDVTQIAAEFGLDRAALAAVIRRVEAVEIVRERQQAGSAGTMLAARTRKQKPDPNSGSSAHD